MRILITGVTGFAGGHLAESLLDRGADTILGTGRTGVWPTDLVHLSGPVPLHACDLADANSVEALLRQAKPEQIYHLAGYTNTGRSFQDVEAAWIGNLLVTRRLYEAVVRVGLRPRILFVGSGLVYEIPPDAAHAHHEDCPLLPASPYAASKAAADLMSYQYTRFPGLSIVRARPFNHVGPRQSPAYALAHFAKQVAAIERGEQPPVLETGNLLPQRDFTDVRDVVRAYILLMERGQSGAAYNVAAGSVVSMERVVDRLRSMAGRAIEVRQKPDLVRSADIPVVRGDADRLRRETGWAPSIAFDQTVADTLDYWRRTK
jgi:GDP-4-dehydro-6-deoxy-D-mannose reductase